MQKESLSPAPEQAVDPASFQTLTDLQNQFDPIEARELQQADSPNAKEHISEIKDFYDDMQNPINDDTTLVAIVDAYSKMNDGLGGLYGSLQKVGIEDKETRLINVKDRERFEEKCLLVGGIRWSICRSKIFVRP